MAIIINNLVNFMNYSFEKDVQKKLQNFIYS